MTNRSFIKKVNKGCLIDIAINNVVTNQFGKYLEKLDSDWYHSLPQKFIAQFKQRHISAEIYPTDIDPKQNKKGVFNVSTDGDKLLVIELQHLGAIRDYYGFIPTSTPKVYCVLKGQLIDQQDKKVLWRHVVKIEDPVQGNWDQPPYYPNFTNAFKEAMVSAQEEIVNSFFSGH